MRSGQTQNQPYWEPHKLLDNLGDIAALSQTLVMGLFMIFLRISAVIAFMPGFGEQAIPMRLRLAVSVAFTLLVWPLVPLNPLPTVNDIWILLPYFMSEAFIGVLLGLSIRFILIALQFAGSIASQATSLAQMMGPGATPDPMPAIGNILVLGGLVLAFASGLHVKAAAAMVQSYEVFPLGSVPRGPDVGDWIVSRGVQMFDIAFTIAAPFLVASFAYNLTLGMINKAMPQLMVAFIGAPAITAGGILILFIAAPMILTTWLEHLDGVLATPFEIFP